MAAPQLTTNVVVRSTDTYIHLRYKYRIEMKSNQVGITVDTTLESSNHSASDERNDVIANDPNSNLDDDESRRPTPPPLESDRPPKNTNGTTTNPGILRSMSTTNILDMSDRKSPSSAAQDTHPYARGAVIEVWHIPKAATSEATTTATTTKEESYWKMDEDDDWWSEESSVDEDETGDVGTEEGRHGNDRNRTIRLCDIIDRVPTSSKSGWRYYVHYRDFNRRMDEWIHASRIVSPPSVGNAKARALKREEERNRKRKLYEQQEAAAAAAGVQQQQLLQQQNQQRGRSRRTSAAILAHDTVMMAAGRHETPDGRRTRLSRRKSTNDPSSGMEHGLPDMEDDATVTVLNTSTGSTTAPSPKDASKSTNAAAYFGGASTSMPDVLVTDTTAVTMTVVGEHTVATVQAVEFDEHEGMDASSLREHEEVTKVKNVGFLELGRYQMETWYFSPLPKELIHDSTKESTTSAAAATSTGFLEVLYVCEFTFRMFARKCELQRFQTTIPPAERHPPGNEIYRNGNLSMFEVDGLDEKIYCQNLCYIAKLFLDHKTLYYDVDPFLFYVLCEVDDRGYHPVGYYSKEKYSDVGYNLACILSFPSQQRKGYGRFLIAFSYELSKKEDKVGSPEKPLSDLGQQAYKPYWASTVIDFLLHQSDESALSIMDISKRTSIMAEDIVYTLNQLGILKIINGVYFIAAERSLLAALAQKYPVKEPRVDPTKLHWTPFLTDIKRDKFSIHSKKPSVEAEGVNSSFTTSASNI